MNLPALIRDPLLKLARTLGYGIYKINRERAPYGPYLPEASYSPWNLDVEFIEAYRAVRPNTLVDEYRCHELWTLVRELRHLRGDLIEIGVWRGGTGALLARKAQLEGLDAKIYLCDTFSGVVKATDKDSTYVGGEHADTSRELVEDLLARMNLGNACILQGIFPDETGDQVRDTRFRMCHIDVDVYQSAKDIVDWIWDRLEVGGCIVYDDYGHGSTVGIARFVDEQRGLPDRVTLHNLNGHAVTVKTR